MVIKRGKKPTGKSGTKRHLETSGNERGFDRPRHTRRVSEAESRAIAGVEKASTIARMTARVRDKETKSSPLVIAADAPVRDGYLTDFISGKTVKDGPEEREAVQVFARMLVEDYGYPKTHIQTRPQYRVKVRPSDTRKEYPIDIAVFGDEKKGDDGLYIVVECKKKDRKDGKTQLQDYLRFCKAGLGVWFNGQERLFLKKN